MRFPQSETDNSVNSESECILADVSYVNVRPKAFIVIGNWSEFAGPTGVHEDKISSFEQFRNGIQGIEILTFDELFERSRFIAESATDAPTAGA